jgi:type II secretory pathway component GspD/PulD (secretin)
MMRKFSTALYAVTLLLLSAAPIALAQPAPTTTKPVVPLQLKPLSNAPVNLHITDQSKAIYQAIGKMAGINVLFDSDYQSKQIQVDLSGTSLSDALRVVGALSGTFYKPVNADTIFIAQNTRAKHTDFDELATETFYLKNASQQADANEVVTALRNTLSPESKIFLVANDNAIVVRTTPELIEEARALLNDLDLPKKSYRLTYTVTEIDGGKPVGTQHFAMVLVSGQETTLKQGSRVPIATGSYNANASASANPAGIQTQYTYLDIGMNFDASLGATGNGAMLKSSVEQSSIAEERSGVGAQDPIVRQTSLRGVFFLTPNKPLVLGSIDIPGSTRRLDIEVVMEQLP